MGKHSNSVDITTLPKWMIYGTLAVIGLLILASAVSSFGGKENTAQTDSTSAGYVADDVQSSTGSSFSLDAPAAKGQGVYHISSNFEIINLDTLDRTSPRAYAAAIKEGWVFDSENKRITSQFSYADMRNLWIEIVSPDGTKKRVSGISINEKKELVASPNDGFNSVYLTAVKNGNDMSQYDHSAKWTTRPLDLDNFKKTGVRDPRSKEISFEISLDV